VEVRIMVIGSDLLCGTDLVNTEAIASAILAATGAKLRWERGNALPQPPGAIAVRFAQFPPKNRPDGALAETALYGDGGGRITVFLDPVWTFAERRPLFLPRVVAHVLAHEIGHVLRGNDAHSTGIMKAHWDEGDFRSIVTKGLPFAAEDIEAIRARLTH
jgi:hypothetical protein